jgi:hypothetical protein
MSLPSNARGQMLSTSRRLAMRPIRRHVTRAVQLACVLALIFASLMTLMQGDRAEASSSNLSGLRVQGNTLVNGSDDVVRLRGVNRASAEYACVQGWGIFHGPTDQASVDAMKQWNINAVRIPMNEHCWLGNKGTAPEYSGSNYQNAIRDYVNLLTQNGIVAILDLHWVAPNGQVANELRPMPDRDNAGTFWQQVATTFKSNSMVVFDLYNEPYPDSNRDTTEAWRCWRDGGTCAGVPYQAAGMQELVTAVRNTGAPNVIMLTGILYGAGLDRWLEYKPNDPLNNLMASWHIYPFSWYANDAGYWNTHIATLSKSVPLIAGEVGQTDCGTSFATSTMTWLDNLGASYLAWVWTPWGGCEPVITNYAGTPTQPYGLAIKHHMLGTTPPPATPTPSEPSAPRAWVTPQEGQAVSGTIDLKVSGSAGRVEFFYGNWSWVGRDSDASDGWIMPFDTRVLPDGANNFWAAWYGTDDALLSVEKVNVIVANSGPPPTPTPSPTATPSPTPSPSPSATVPSTPTQPAWVTPKNGDTVSGTIELTVAGDAQRVEFHYGAWAWVGRDTNGADGWSITFDTRVLGNGANNFWASWYAADGSLITYQRVDVTVANTADTIPPTVVASPRGGTYVGTQSITLSSSEPATIYYTTNGANPTISSTRYSGPITLTATATLKFMAIDAAGNQSGIATESYTIQPLSAPSAPSSLTVTLSATAPTSTVVLRWKDNSSNEAKFVIQRSTTSTFTQNIVTFEVGANVVTYTDSSLKGKTSYYYRVIAAGSTGLKSSPSNVVAIKTR